MVNVPPKYQDLNKEVAREMWHEHLWDDKQVQRQSRPQHNRHVRNIKELDRIDDDGKNDDSQEQTHDVGSLSLQKALRSAQPLLCHVNRRWVVGEKAFQWDLQMLVAINKLVPDPRP